MNADAQAMVAAIEAMYAAASIDDRAGVHATLTPDFHVFENGVHMPGDELWDLLSGDYAEGKRMRWSVTKPLAELSGDFGAVVYVNVGSITETAGAEPTPLTWLETVLLRRDATGWRVAFLHSTRTKAASST